VYKIYKKINILFEHDHGSYSLEAQRRELEKWADSARETIRHATDATPPAPTFARARAAVSVTPTVETVGRHSRTAPREGLVRRLVGGVRQVVRVLCGNIRISTAGDSGQAGDETVSTDSR